jgi:hypothetical protein
VLPRFSFQFILIFVEEAFRKGSKPTNLDLVESEQLSPFHHLIVNLRK